MIGIAAVHHIAVCVTDLERAKRFYEDVLGLRPLDRPALSVEGAWYSLGNGQLHLIVHPATRTLRGTREIDIADGHFALRIADFNLAVTHLRAHGVELLERAQNATAWQQLYFTDPDGNVIELNAAREG
jgi:catechol 2,3-dioxygenase-like lactoylglutathione lyase family enzyme